MFKNNHDQLNLVRQHNYYHLYLDRQRELKAEAQNYRLSSMISEENDKALRKRIGAILISFGQKLAQESERDIRLAFSAQR